MALLRTMAGLGEWSAGGHQRPFTTNAGFPLSYGPYTNSSSHWPRVVILFRVFTRTSNR
jgi:hypothetical protein